MLRAASGDGPVFIVHLILNASIVAVELGLAAGTAWLAWKMPLVFAGLTAILAGWLGLRLEVARLNFEMPFYFEGTGALGSLLRVAMGIGHATLKAVAAGLVAVITFSGTDENRLLILAGLLFVCTVIGSAVLRRITISYGARPARWGFFRMAVPLGLIFSAAVSFFPAPSSLAVAQKVLLDLPARPSVAQAGEALFAIRLWIDDLLVRMIASATGPEWAKAIGIVVGSSVLAGFVIAIYAVAISEVVRVLEEAHWRLKGNRRVRG